MGTSSMYSGYSNGNSGGNPLLPDDFEDNENVNQDGKNDNIADDDVNSDDKDGINNKNLDRNVSWQTAKTSMSKAVTGKSSISKAVSNYVKAHGGAKTASKTARSAVGTIINIGQLFNNISTQGFAETLEKYNIDYVDKSAKDVLSELINFLAPTPVTKEDSVARKALIITMEYLYESLEKENLEIDKINNDTLNFIIPTYVECYLYERLINDLGSRIETTSLNSGDAIEIEQQIKDYINAKVDIVFKGKDFGKVNFDKKEVESLYNQCYTIMEKML